MKTRFHPRYASSLSKKHSRWLAAVCGLVLCSKTLLPGATFTVTSTADSGNGTLRLAIARANTNADLDTIVFNLSGGGGPKTISPLTPLPEITTPMVIDGWSQGPDGYAGPPLIEISGASCTNPASGFYVRSGGNTIKGLAINRWRYSGITIETNGGNIIQGNYIGTDPTGTLMRGNTNAGILIFRSAVNMIGGTTNGARNIICGNGRGGILLLNAGSAGNVIQGNYIGLGANGTALPNTVNGIFLGRDVNAIPHDYPTDNIIGGSNLGARNVISGNDGPGIYIVAVESEPVVGPTRNRIIGNYIGSDTNGLLARANIGSGIELEHASGNVIGGFQAGERNLISGNVTDGIFMDASSNNVVQGNYIGTDVTGMAPLANLLGVTITGGSSNFIGGSVSNSGNLISGNDVDGIELGFGTTGNQVVGNVIGLSSNLLVRIPNGRHGVGIFDSTNNAIGTLDYAPNYIIGNAGNGVFIGRGVLNAGSVSNLVQGNLIATNGMDGIQLSSGADWNKILGNVVGGIGGFVGTTLLGNGRHGVAIFDSSNNVVGASSPQFAWNNISGNRSNGVFIGKGVLASGSFSNTVVGNQIGNNQMGNGGSGIFVQGSGNLIGGFDTHDGNRIGFNGTNLMRRGHGVVIESGTNNAIVGNEFKANTGRAIDLGNDSFTVNDLGDGDSGANDLQNYPVVTRVSFGQFSHEITWTLNSKPNRTYQLQVYANSEPDPSGFGEGERLIRIHPVQTDADGFAEYTMSFIPEDDRFISATATDLEDMNTSEFSPVDTDGDAIADAWEITGIDYDEDGTNDLKLAGANWEQKDIYVEIDAMTGRAPNMAILGGVNLGTLDERGRDNNDGFLNAPADKVQNPNGAPGVIVHLELDETNLPFASWPTPPTYAFQFFDTLKSNYFGTLEQFTNANALKAKQLFYHYCIFADTVPDELGRARDFTANDFYITMGDRSSSPTDIGVAGVFMHELGHCLGLRHGGIDHHNFKPNYHSIMNYAWDSENGGNRPFKLDFSRETFPTLNEAALNEGAGIGASGSHSGHKVKVGPHLAGTNKIPILRALETGPVDWNGNTNTTDVGVARDINYLSGTNASPGDTLVSSVDWSRLRYYFLDGRTTGSIFMIDGDPTDLPPSVLEEFEKLGTGVGQFQFSPARYTVSETGAVAVISVTRIFEAEANVSVSFSTFNGTATSGLDYVTTNGILNFTGSESVKTFTVPLLNDGSAEQVETFQLALSNPTGGATLGPSDQATITIVDDDPPGHFTVSNTNNSGAGSIRQAILDANSSPGLGIIDFNIPGSSGLTFSPSTALPTITNRITINGTTQSGFAGAPIIELNGTSAGANTDGLQITAGHCTIRGLVINRFSRSGINLLNGGANRIEGCYIGLSRTGTLDQGNTGDGIAVQSPDNVIGGTSAAARNFVSGNNASGIIFGGVSATNNQVLGNVIGLGVDGSDQGNSGAGVNISAPENTVGGRTANLRNVISGNNQDGVLIGNGTGSRVLGNYIGTDLTGTAARSNSANGIKVISASGVLIGGDKSGEGNLISGNTLRGLELESSDSAVLLGNRIGTDVFGTYALPNQTGGIRVTFGANHRIGDTTPFGANIIAFNNGPGVFVTGGFNNSIRGNSIFANSHPVFPDYGLGIDLGTQGITANDTNDTDTGANQLQNHPVLASASNSLTGTLIAGTLNSRPNTNYTIDFYANAALDASGYGEGQFWIGATTVATDGGGNASFNFPTPAIYLKGNYITATATDAAGNTSEFSPAVSASSMVEGRTFTVVNTNDSAEGSLRQAIIDANAFISERDTIEFEIPSLGVHTIRPLSPLPTITDPVLIDGYSQPGSSPNTAATGHNGVLLVELDGSLAGAVHGLRIEAGNSIVRGLVVNRFAAGADINAEAGGIVLSVRDGNRLEGNFIGTDPTGFVDRGNAFRGVLIFQSSSNVIGGTLPAMRNVISGNDVGGGIVSGEAVLVVGSSTLQFSGNRIEGNLLGTAANGIAPLGNSGCAVRFNQPVTNTTIGGTAPGAGNVIAFNSAADSGNNACGVGDPLTFGPRGIAVLGNSIHSNFGLGIGGNLVNSPDGRGNFPLLSSALSSNGITTIQGRLNSVSNAPHRIEFFANDTFDPSGHGEGKIFLGATNVPTDSNGFAAFTAMFAVTVSNSMFIAATATDDRNNTSEFSPRLRVGDVLTNVIVVNSINDVDDGVANTNHTSLREAILAANNHTGPDTIRFAIGTGAKTIGLTNSLPPLLDAGTTIDATTQPGFTGAPLIYLDGLFQSPAGFRLYSPSNTIRGFAINRFGHGIYGDAAFSSPFGGFNIIEGNYLGTDLTSSGAAGSQDYGIYFTSSFLPGGFPDNRIGGTTTATRNVISGNIRAGIYAFGSAGNTIAGNFVGTDRTGTNAVGNGRGIQPIGGVFLQRCQGTVVGGSTPGAGNLISGNASLFQNQFFLWDDCSGSVVQGNFIGTDVTGRTNIGSIGGIDVLSTGPVLIKSNLICGFGGGGAASVRLGSSSNRVEGNFIGTDVTGTRAILIPSGIVISPGATANVIGGTEPGSRNVISGGTNTFFGGGSGIRIQGGSNIVHGNFIGTQVDGVSPIGNFAGVAVESSFNLIGGTGPGMGNTIAFSVGSGVSISAGVSNAVLGNSIFSNVGLGIDLGAAGVTTNDSGDLDSGANNLQNFPLLSAARNIGFATLIQGTLNSRSNTSFRIEFFSNTNCHSSGFGPGRAFLNATTSTTDAAGNATISFTHPAPVPVGQVVTATATDPDNNTSEFSPCVTVINDTNYVVLNFTTSNPYTLAWPTSAQNFLLERATNLSPPVIWQVFSNGIMTNGENKVFAIPNDPATPASFFRLHRP